MKLVRRILKFNLLPQGVSVVTLPEGSIVRHVGDQGANFCIWIECPCVDMGEGGCSATLNPQKVKRSFLSLFTGHDDVPSNAAYIGTAQFSGLVVHVYEIY